MSKSSSVGRKLRSGAAGGSAGALALAGAITLAGSAQAEEIPDYEPTVESLNSHPLPDWFDDAKLGIFIHWGAYSVPAYAPVDAGGHGGYNYAEWYGSFMNTVGSPFYEYHRDTYGIDKNYDDFLNDWKAENFEPEAWVDLIKDAGARYVVLTSKHHEGIALWDSDTQRDVVDHGPKRDLIGDLFEAIHDDGTLKAGFYYSLLEWYNPKSPGGSALANPYTGEPVPYLGVDVDEIGDYVHDYMQPQVEDLIDSYDPDILWCDGQWAAGAATWDMAPVIADYYNQAKNRPDPKGVVVANRCKIETGELDSPELDFQTPEYTVKGEVTEAKWESSRGVGNSYGYNQFETEAQYQTADEIIDSLVDIVSKNGNLLLNIGPKADGTIPDIQRDRLESLGDWLDINGEAIYGTTYYSYPEDGAASVPIRYTVKDGALYATALEWPAEGLTLQSGAPFAAETTVELLGSDDGPLAWEQNGDGTVSIDVPADSSATASENAYVFKISTPGQDTLLRTSLDVPGVIPGVTVEGTVTISNTSREEITDLDVRLAGPSDWIVAPMTTRIAGLPGREEVSIPVRVTAAPTATPGEFPIEVTTTTSGSSLTVSHTVSLSTANVALNKDAQQDSTYTEGGGNTYGPAKAVDGNTIGNSSNLANTVAGDEPAWWQVDLGAEYDLDDVAVWNRYDCCTTRLTDYTIAVSSSPFPERALTAEDLESDEIWSTVQEGQAGRPTTTQTPTTGRYVRIQLPTAEVELNLSEVEVHGVLADAVTPEADDVTLLVDGAEPGELVGGSTVELTVGGLFPESPFSIGLAGAGVTLADGVADLEGNATLSVTLPELEAGEDLLRLSGFDSNAYRVEVDSPVTVTAAPDPGDSDGADGADGAEGTDETEGDSDDGAGGASDGSDGADGQDGQDGRDGANGSDGQDPAGDTDGSDGTDSRADGASAGAGGPGGGGSLPDTGAGGASGLILLGGLAMAAGALLLLRRATGAPADR